MAIIKFNMLLKFRGVTQPVYTNPYVSTFAYPTCCRRFASGYGDTESGKEQATNQQNPKAYLEHPGPDRPKASEKGDNSSSLHGSQGKDRSIDREDSTKRKVDLEVGNDDKEKEQ